MSEMVERVARAIEEAFLEQRVSAKVWGGVSGIVPPIDMARVARDAIVALREPTEAMEDAPWRAHVQLYEPSDLTQVLDCVSFKRVYQAMIDEALK